MQLTFIGLIRLEYSEDWLNSLRKAASMLIIGVVFV
jgi:hypothetical protein